MNRYFKLNYIIKLLKKINIRNYRTDLRHFCFNECYYSQFTSWLPYNEIVNLPREYIENLIISSIMSHNFFNVNT